MVQTRSAQRTRRITDAGAVVDARIRRLDRRPPEQIRAGLGVVRCPTCRQDTIPLRSGRCGWCERQLTKAAA